MSKQKITLIIILIFLAGNIFGGYKYFVLRKELEAAKSAAKDRQINEKVLDFTELFIEKVLKAETEVDFETRLKLENAARDLEDKEILAQWQKFTGSANEIEAQTEVKNLLEALIDKIRIK